MRRFARRLKHLRLRREARFRSRPPARPAEHDTPERRERRHAVPARLEGSPPRAPAPGPAARRQPLDEPVQLLLPASRARALRRARGRALLHLPHAHHRRVGEALRDPDPWRSQERLHLLAAGWGGGTRIGECLHEFNRSDGVAPRALAHRRDHRQRRLRHRRTRAPRDGTRRAAATGAAHGLAQSAPRPARFQPGKPRHAGGAAATSTSSRRAPISASIEQILPDLIEALR